ncbi:MAG: site-2 protease family protein [Methanomassiliicoccales archaeon]|nr:site-2 protease family protein [Methanomassiliicoccales archaeon]
MNAYVIAALVIAAYIVIFYILMKKGILEKHGIHMWGPILMWRTQKGKNLIERLSKPKRFWSAYSTLAKFICIGVMIFIMALLIWEATLVASIPAEKAPGPELMLGIPGINPVIPIWYGILGLVVAIVVHEFSHGILTRVGGMPLKSLGLVFLVIPLGAFVEPDEKELTKAEKKKRTSVYAAGPAANVIVAIICALLFSTVFLSSVAPVRDGQVVISIATDGPADRADLSFGSQIVSIDGQSVLTKDEFDNFTAPLPGENVTVQYYFSDTLYSKEVTSGVAVTQTASGLPAADAGIEVGMIIASLNDTSIRNASDLKETLSLTHPHQTVNITILTYYEGSGKFEVFSDLTTITLASKKEYYLRVAPDLVGPDFKDSGYLGVNTAYLGASVNSPEVVVRRLAHPMYGVESAGDAISSTLYYLALPFAGLAPIQSPITDLFAPSGLFAGIPVEAFWVISNCLYWIFWINIMVGMTNVLPAIPLDGGYLFKDWLDSLVVKVKKDATEKDRDKYVSTITYVLALAVLFLIIWQLIGPRLF